MAFQFGSMMSEISALGEIPRVGALISGQGSGQASAGNGGSVPNEGVGSSNGGHNNQSSEEMMKRLEAVVHK
eukprot:3125779-Karenia_brevis.AAC.1